MAIIRKRPDQSEPIQGVNLNVGMQNKDTQNLYNKKHKSRKHAVNASDRLDKLVYSVFSKKSGTTNMVCEMLGNKYDYSQVRKSILRLVERRFIGYWGTDYCEVTGHKAWYLEIRDSELKYTPIKSNSHAR